MRFALAAGTAALVVSVFAVTAAAAPPFFWWTPTKAATAIQRANPGAKVGSCPGYSPAGKISTGPDKGWASPSVRSPYTFYREFHCSYVRGDATYDLWIRTSRRKPWSFCKRPGPAYPVGALAKACP